MQAVFLCFNFIALLYFTSYFIYLLLIYLLTIIYTIKISLMTRDAHVDNPRPINSRKYNAIRMDMMHEVSQFCQLTLHTLLFGTTALTDEANESIFKYVHKFI